MLILVCYGIVFCCLFHLQGEVRIERDERGIKLPSQPTLPAAKRLRKLLKDRLALYKDIPCLTSNSLTSAQRFLCSERILLETLLNQVREIIVDLEDDEL